MGVRTNEICSFFRGVVFFIEYLVFCVEVLLFYELIHPFTISTRGSSEAVWVSGQICCIYNFLEVLSFFYLIILLRSVLGSF